MAKVYGTEIEVNTELKGSAPITVEAIEFIKYHAHGSPILEIGCGSGIYAKILRENGVDVIASDACRITKDGLPNHTHNSRMAKFTNKRAINNMIEKNAVTAVANHGQEENMALFLSFPLPWDWTNKAAYDEIALRNFKGNRFFLIALYNSHIRNTRRYNRKRIYHNEATGSVGFHKYLEEEWIPTDTLLLQSGKIPGTHTYLIYFTRKGVDLYSHLFDYPNNNSAGGAVRKCPKHSAKEYKLKTVKKGLDGKMWIVSKRSDGVKFWKRK